VSYIVIAIIVVVMIVMTTTTIIIIIIIIIVVVVVVVYRSWTGDAHVHQWAKCFRSVWLFVSRPRAHCRDGSQTRTHARHASLPE
jgi:hypothetical protein